MTTILTPKQIFDLLSVAAENSELTAADLKLLIFVSVTRRDGSTGQAYVKDLYITEKTGLSRAAIKRSRNKLIASGYIKTTPGSVNRHATIYTPQLKQGSSLSPVLPSLEGEQRKWGSSLSPVRLTTEPSRGSAVSPLRPKQGSTMSPVNPTPGLQPDGRWFIKYDSPQWDYHDAHSVKTTGRRLIRGRGVGAFFATEWPQETKQ